MIWKAICRDILSRQRIYLFCISLIFVLIVRDSLSYNYHNMTTLLFSVLLVSFIGSWQLFFSYFKSDRIQGYYQLPISLPIFNFTFLCVTFVSNLIERVLLIVLLFEEQNWKHIILLVFYSFLVILSGFRLIRYLTSSKKTRFKIFVAVYIIFSLIVFPIVESFYLLFLLFIIEFIFILRDDTYFYLDDISSKSHSLNFKNYFLTAIAKERYFYFNFAISILFIFILFIQNIPESLKFPMLFAIASTNTPLTTIISSTPQLNSHLRSLPKSFKVYGMYLRCLLYYFFVINSIIAILYISIGHNLFFVVWVWLYTIFESVIYLLLEKYFFIENWNIKKELWKHPRKYIVPILTYLFFFILFM